MVPALPSTVTSCPECRRMVASQVPTTAGIPYSRATREACAARVPLSVMTAAARANRGVHAGAVAFATSTSPSRKPPKSWGPCTRCTGPVARPADAGCPTMTPSLISRSPRASCTARSITSAISRAGCPSVKGARRGCACRRHQSQTTRRETGGSTLTISAHRHDIPPALPAPHQAAGARSSWRWLVSSHGRRRAWSTHGGRAGWIC